MSQPPSSAPQTRREARRVAGAGRRGHARMAALRAAAGFTGLATAAATRAAPLRTAATSRLRAARVTVQPAAERTRRFWQPVLTALGWVSGLGWTILAAGAICWVAGVRYGWTELLIIAAAAIVLLLACVVLALGRAQVDIRAEVEPRRVTVGEPATGHVLVRNVSKAPMLPLVVELPVGLSAARFVLPPLRAGSEHEELFVVPTHRRGVIAVGPARTVQGDPLGLVRRTIGWTRVRELFVHPRTAALEPLGAGLLRDLEGSVTEDHSMSDLAFHALREYQPGDDRRHIHWRSSAKAGTLLVRVFLDTRRSHVTAIIDTDPRSFLGGEQILQEWTQGRTEPLVAAHRAPEVRDLETAISVGGSIALRVMRDEQDATVVTGSHEISRSTPHLMLDTLARVEPAAADLVPLALRGLELAPDTSTVFIITGPHRSFLDIQRAAGQFPPEVRAVVVVVDPGATRGIRHGGGLVILTIGELSHLRSVLVAGVMA